MRKLRLLLLSGDRGGRARVRWRRQRGPPPRPTTTSRCRSRPAWRRRRRWAGTAGTSSRATSTRTSSRGSPRRWCDSGMKDVGYQYINIDDCWSLAARAADGSLQPDPARFPDGIKPVADFVHGLGLKLGIYGDRGIETCGHRAGSEDHEVQDAMTFASWGVDYLKYDNCPDPGPNPGPIIQPRFEAMRAALDDATGRPIVFSVCAWSFYEWATRVGHLQRTTTDIKNDWIARSQFDRSRIDHDQPQDQPAARRLRRPQPLERSRHAGGRQQRQRRRPRHRRREPEPLQPVGDHRGAADRRQQPVAT